MAKNILQNVLEFKKNKMYYSLKERGTLKKNLRNDLDSFVDSRFKNVV